MKEILDEFPCSVTVIQILEMFPDFRKALNICPAALVSSDCSHVSQYPACFDQNTQHGNLFGVWYIIWGFGCQLSVRSIERLAAAGIENFPWILYMNWSHGTKTVNLDEKPLLKWMKSKRKTALVGIFLSSTLFTFYCLSNKADVVPYDQFVKRAYEDDTIQATLTNHATYVVKELQLSTNDKLLRLSLEMILTTDSLFTFTM